MKKTAIVAIPGSFRVYEVDYESILENNVRYNDVLSVRIKNKDVPDMEYLENWRRDQEEIDTYIDSLI